MKRIAIIGLFIPLLLAAKALQPLEKPTRVTLTGTTWDELTVPNGAEYLVIRPIASAAQFTRGCTDGGALGTHYRTLAADTDYTIHIGKATDANLCLNGTASAVVEVTAMQRGR